MSFNRSPLHDPPHAADNYSASAGTRRFSWGIFEVVYDYPARIFPQYRNLSDYKNFQITLCFFREIVNVAPDPLALHAIGCLWMSISPALSLYLSHAILDIISTQISVVKPQVKYCDGLVLQVYIALWLLTATASALVDRILEENKIILGAHLRSHFLPQLANASLRLDVDFVHDHNFRGLFPNPWAFGEGAPGLSFVKDLFTRLRNIITLTLEVLVLVRIISVTQNPDASILTFFVALFLTVMCCAPSNAIGGTGYAFYTKNEHFHRLHGLYRTIFDVKYRETLIKDGASNYLSKEFKRTSDALGVSKADATSLACYLPPPWYCVLFRTLFFDYPMAMYAFTLPWSLSSSSIATMALFQHTSTTLRQSIERLRGGQYSTPVSEIMNQIRKFYETLECEKHENTTVGADYPSYFSSPRGIRVSFRNISLSYGESAGDSVWALRNVWFDIEPGQLVVIVGENGSGKTSLLKLLPRLAAPTCGEVLIDDVPLKDYDIHQLRRSMAFLTQSEEIYPVSLQENILMGLPDDMDIPVRKQELVDEAARLGGSYDLIKRVGYEIILNPPNILGQSLRGCGNGDIGPRAMEELGRHTANFKETPISCGERQRLLASRTFMRVVNGNIKLLVVDEPTSAMDPVSERNLFNHFLEMRNGRTSIIVTHRFGNIVKHADLILCMKAGQIVQRGHHDELICHEKGEYARLFRAQGE